MRLLTVNTLNSPDTHGSIRITADVVFASGDKSVLWVDVPAGCSSELALGGNPWLLAMLPVAASRGEDIQLSLPVDALLLENLRGVLQTWREWYPDLHDVAIDCPVASASRGNAGAVRRSAAFFSGGVDSYCTVARRLPRNAFGLPVVGRLDDLITVWGFDVGVHDDRQFGPMVERLRASARHLGLNHLLMRTNLREFDPVYQRRWGPLTFGVGLAFIGLVLEGRLGELIIGSSYPFGALVPWGSHPMIDPLFSTSGLKVTHDGASFTRVEKTAIAAQLPMAGSDLHVCQASGVDNCSQCEKCYRTMVAIDILGQRERFQHAFDWSDYRLKRVETVYMGSGDGRVFYREMIDAATHAGRPEIARALRRAMARSVVLAPLVAGADLLAKTPLLWRIGRNIRRAILAGSVAARYIEHPKKAAESA